MSSSAPTACQGASFVVPLDVQFSTP